MQTYKTLNAKVLVNHNVTTDISSELSKFKDYFLRHGIQINLVPQNVSLSGYTPSMGQTTFGTSQMILEGFKPLLDPYVSASDDVCYFLDNTLSEFGNNVPSDSTQGFLSNGHTVAVHINAGDWWDDIPGNLSLWMQHETMHALGLISGANGFPVVDCMDVMTVNGVQQRYYLNDQPDNVNSNFINMWERLYPWLSSPNKTAMTTVTIRRTTDNGHETTGILTFGSFTCNTLERPWLNNQHDISCIPKGAYQCVIAPFHDTHYYELQNVPNRTGIFIHPANYVTDLLGCIALGVNPSDINHDGLQDVTSSQDTVAKFMALLGGKPFTLVIE